MPRRPPPPEADPDAVLQRIADLEALLTSPGWAYVLTEISTRYGPRAFIETMGQLTKQGTAQQIGEHAIAIVAAHQAVGEVLELPRQRLAELQRKVATQREPPERPTLGPNVEYSG
jgi:hypothetical protein